jgi:hypothetical protein
VAHHHQRKGIAMGWINEEAPTHEGYIAGFVDGGRGRLREIGYPEDDKPISAVGIIGAACSCGWRSKRFHAPLGTEWGPFVLLIRSEHTENQLVGLWAEHVKAELEPRGRLRADMLPYDGGLI